MNSTGYQRLIILWLVAGFTLVGGGAPIPHIYDSSADGTQQLARAIATARQANKTVLLQFGGDWCVPCIRLHRFFETNRAVSEALKSNFVSIDVEVNDRNKPLLKTY